MRDQIKNQVESVVAQLCRMEATALNVPFKRRIEASKEKGIDYRVDRYVIEVSAQNFLALKPRNMKDFARRIVRSVEEFDRRRWEEKARHITQAKARVMKEMAYLARALNPPEFEKFIESLNRPGGM